MIKNIIDKSNILTFIGLSIAIIGINFCLLAHFNLAIMCLIIAGICDGFDGTLARLLRKDEKYNFGVQLDSLVDIVSSGIFPVILCSSMGFNKIIDILVYIIFIICGVSRLAYYNITTEENNGKFIGIPITSTCIIIPLVYIFAKCEIAYITALFILSILFVTPIKVKKLNLLGKIILSVIGITGIVFFYYFK